MSYRTVGVPRKVSETHRIIWLDAEIGKDGGWIEFRRRVATSFELGAGIEDSLDECIVAVRENACPFIFIHEPDQALEAIGENHDMRIIFISSGSMAVHIVPQIRATYSNVYSFYIFCAIPANYIALVMENLGCLQVFNHEIDSLIRLMRDISKEIIRAGEAYESIGCFQDALDCFVRARNLYLTANNQDKLHPPILTELHDLEGRDGRSGRIGILRNRLLQKGEIPLPGPNLATKQKQRSYETVYSEQRGSPIGEPKEISPVSYDLLMEDDEDEESHLAIEAV